MQRENSIRITYINFIMTIVIVFLHSNYIPVNNNILIVKLYKIIMAIGDMAVPVFFTLSAYLLFKKLNYSNYLEQIRKRCYSLVLPYFIWSALFYIFYTLLSYIPQTAKFLNHNRVNFTFIGMMKDILFCTYIPQFWYIRSLFILVVLSIIYYTVMQKFGKMVSFLVICILYAGNFIFEFNPCGFVTWMPLFFLSGWFTYFFEKNIEMISYKRSSKMICITAGCVLILGIVVSEFHVLSIVYYIWRNVSPILIFSIFYYVPVEKGVRWCHKQSFTIFAVHYMFVAVYRKIFLNILGTSIIMIIFEYLLTSVFSVVSALIVAKIIERYIPRVGKLLTGNRG